MSTANINISIENEEVVVKFHIPDDADPAIVTLANIVHKTLTDVLEIFNEKKEGTEGV